MTVKEWSELLKRGGDPKYHEKLTKEGKRFARDRIASLCDKGSFVEDGLYANCLGVGLPADGVVTGIGRIGNRRLAIMANDSTVKAGSWGELTVEKILRIQETALRMEIPLFYLVDSAGARITEQIEMFPGRRGAGRIFYHQSTMSGQVPQICLLFGPSAAGGAYIPAFCDAVIMVEGNASMFLGSPRMAEAVIGEKVTLEEMGGARMHCTVSGCGDFLVKSEGEAIALAKNYFTYLPDNYRGTPSRAAARNPRPGRGLKEIIPDADAKTYDMKEVLSVILDEGAFLEIKELFAPEVITGFGRIEGRVVGVVANQPAVRGGVLFVDSADKSARFIQLCSGYNIPLLFLADVPGFMIGSKVEREGIIRAGAKMIYAISNATVPKISLIVRKAYGAGLYAMAGPAFGTDCVLALPTAQMAVMGPEPAVNAVYFNKLMALGSEERQTFLKEKIAEYKKDIDIYRLAAELIVDQMVDFDEVREVIARRLEYCERGPTQPRRYFGIMPM